MLFYLRCFLTGETVALNGGVLATKRNREEKGKTISQFPNWAAGQYAKSSRTGNISQSGPGNTVQAPIGKYCVFRGCAPLGTGNLRLGRPKRNFLRAAAQNSIQTRYIFRPCACLRLQIFRSCLKRRGRVALSARLSASLAIPYGQFILTLVTLPRFK